ncbi:MAG: TonB-dependent receptor [Caulobacteraceae bacterium]|nr:TonB-dependent receptor [Caulobacteraceae bacterium]
MSYRSARAAFASLGVIATLAAPAAATAQPKLTLATVPTPGAPEIINTQVGEVVVTARKRDEALISTPVVETAVGGTELRRRAVTSLDGLSRIVPQLIIAPETGSVQGGIVTMRGISGPEENPFADQAVAFNVDGVQVAKASVRRLSDTDIKQVEVLKGPQALFFGKNSPAGVISIRTNDPSDHLEAGITTGYEFNGQETRTEGYVSGPIADHIDGRIAGYYAHMDGWLNDQTPRSSPYFNTSRDPALSDFGVRGTLKWNPTPKLDAKLKLNYGQIDNKDGGTATNEYINCATGHRQSGSAGECSAGNSTVNTGNGPILGTLPGTQNHFGDGKPFVHQKQVLASLEVNYHIGPSLLLTSVTGYYYVDLRQAQSFSSDYVFLVPSYDPYRDRELSQEIRLTSDFRGPINLAAGVYFSDSHSQTGALSYLFGSNFDLLGPGVGGPTTPFLVNDFFLKQHGQSYSAYLQVIYKPVSVVEIDVGGRYSFERKSLPLVESSQTPFLDASSIVNTPFNRASWQDFSPEVTLAYRPSNNLTLFGSYKHGFLSGGFNSGATDFVANPNLSYAPETIEGGEIGVKSAMLEGALRLNAAAYIYDVNDLQVSHYLDTISTITNAGAVNIKGMEGDFLYRSQLEGLNIHGAISYNDGHYTRFPGAPCYAGQRISEGCTIVNGAPVQDLSGTELIRAPKWNVSGGVNFERRVGRGLKLGLSSDVSYSSSFLTDATSNPSGREPAYTLVDGALRVSSETGRWELSLVGRNLTDRHFWVSSVGAPFTGSGTGTAIGMHGDIFGAVSRGREVVIRASYKY